VHRPLLTAIACVFVLAVAQPLDAVRRPKRTRRPASTLTVTPSEAIETYVRSQIARAEAILKDLEPVNLLDSPYVVSAVYYHDGFLSRYPEDKPDADPSRRVIAHVVKLLTPELKRRYIVLLHRRWEEMEVHLPEHPFIVPVRNPVMGKKRRRRRDHPYAIDLFVKEGSPVLSASNGLVLVAEGGWSPSDPVSTSSREGGNTVVIFDPVANRFYRYAHLQSVVVETGACVEAGSTIGAVGHTGFNASRPGHGRHLHFEANYYGSESMRPLTNEELRSLILEHLRTEP